GQTARAVAFSPDGQTVAIGAFPGRKVWLWSPGQGALLRKLEHEPGVRAITGTLFSPDGRTLVTAGLGNSVRLWDTASGQPRGEPLPHGPGTLIPSLAFSANSALLATGCHDGVARIWDVATATLRHQLAHAKDVVAVAFDPTGARLVTGSIDGTARIWDTG